MFDSQQEFSLSQHIKIVSETGHEADHSPPSSAENYTSNL